MVFSESDLRVGLPRPTPKRGSLERRQCLLRVKIQTVMTTITSSTLQSTYRRETEARGGKPISLDIQRLDPQL